MIFWRKWAKVLLLLKRLCKVSRLIKSSKELFKSLPYSRLEFFWKIFYPTHLFWVSSITCLDLIQSLKYVSKFVKTMWSISSNRLTDKLLSMLSLSQSEIAKTLWKTSCGRTCLWSRLFWAFENTISNFSWKIICKEIYRTVNHQWNYVHIIWFLTSSSDQKPDPETTNSKKKSRKSICLF